MRAIQILIIFAAFFNTSTLVTAQNSEAGNYTERGIFFIENNISEALSKAQKSNRLIFVDAYTTWCGPCKMMTKNIFPDKDVAELYNANFINLKMDMEKGEGIGLTKRYEVTAYPTLLFLDGNGQLIHKALGYHDVKDFIELGKNALDTDKSLIGWATQYEKGNREPSFLKEYALKLAAAYDNRRLPIAEAYLATQKDWTTDDNLDFIYRFTEKADSKFFDYFLTYRTAFEKKYNPAEIEAKIQGLMADALFDEKNIPTLSLADSLIQKVYADKSDRTSKKYRLNYYRMKGDREKYAESAITYLKKYNDSAEELGDISALFYEQIGDKKMLKKAVSWAKKAVKMDNSYFNNLTLANLYHSTDKKSKALKAAKKAIEVAKKNEESSAEAEELIESLK